MEKNDHDSVDTILRINPIGHVILPILRPFRDLDINLYRDICASLFRAYEAGVRGALSDLATTPKDFHQ